jgi:hypothetical protein
MEPQCKIPYPICSSAAREEMRSAVNGAKKVDSQLNDFLNEIHRIAILEPSIVERIDEDLDHLARSRPDPGCLQCD